MAHIEFSISELADQTVPSQPRVAGAGQAFEGPLERWAFVVSGAQEPCVLIDSTGLVVAASPGCGALFSIDPAEAVGRPLVDGVLRLLDFNAVSGGLPGWEVTKIPPMLAIHPGVLARGLVRVYAGEVAQTVDAISTPLRDHAAVVGSLTFFAPVGQ